MTLRVATLCGLLAWGAAALWQEVTPEDATPEDETPEDETPEDEAPNEATPEDETQGSAGAARKEEVTVEQWAVQEALGLPVEPDAALPIRKTYTAGCKPHEEMLVRSARHIGPIGSSLHLGGSPSKALVTWTTGNDGRNDTLITLPYNSKSGEYLDDLAKPNGTIAFRDGRRYSTAFGFDKAEIGGCDIHNVRVGTIKDPRSELDTSNAMAGLAPIPNESTHPYLVGRAPRIAFCYPKGKDGRLLWGAARPPRGRSHKEFSVLDGLEAHHWAVNVTGFMIQHPKDGKTMEWVPRPHHEHQKVAKDPTAYMAAIFDTSASVLVVPTVLVKELKQYLDDRNLVDCLDRSRLPMLTVEVGGTAFHIPPALYLSKPGESVFPKYFSCVSCADLYGGRYAHRDLDTPLYFPPQLDEYGNIPNDKCALMLAPPAPFSGVFVLGLPFLELFTTTFDYERRKVALAWNIDGQCNNASMTPGSAARRGAQPRMVTGALALLATLMLRQIWAA